MRAWWKQHKGKIIGGASAVLVVVLLALPYVAWHLRASVPLDVIVVDKSVPSQDYRKHAGLFWVLSHEKVVQPDTRLPLDRTRDYVGYHPATSGPGTIVPIQRRDADLIYLSDTYGVYEDDLMAHPTGARSSKIYGGLSLPEVQTILDDLRPGGTLVGEFNTVATPTPRPARDRLAAVFGIIPTGWVARHFQYLDLTPDLPQWLPRTWLAQTGERWDFRGPGYVFVHDTGRMVVLLEGVDTPSSAIRLHLDGEAAGHYGTVGQVGYDGWVEIVEPTDRAEVIATYELRLTDTGAAKMRSVPFSGRIPAAIRTRSPSRTTYYFAGDWSDRPTWSRFDYAGIARFKRLVTPGDRDGVEPFFWGVYVPLMQHVIREVVRTRAARPSSPASAASTRTAGSPG